MNDDERNKLYYCLATIEELKGKNSKLESENQRLKQDLGFLRSQVTNSCRHIDENFSMIDARFKKMEQLKELLLYHD